MLVVVLEDERTKQRETELSRWNFSNEDRSQSPQSSRIEDDSVAASPLCSAASDAFLNESPENGRVNGDLDLSILDDALQGLAITFELGEILIAQMFG